MKRTRFFKKVISIVTVVAAVFNSSVLLFLPMSLTLI